MWIVRTNIPTFERSTLTIRGLYWIQCPWRKFLSYVGWAHYRPELTFILFLNVLRGLFFYKRILLNGITLIIYVLINHMINIIVLSRFFNRITKHILLLNCFVNWWNFSIANTVLIFMLSWIILIYNNFFFISYVAVYLMPRKYRLLSVVLCLWT